MAYKEQSPSSMRRFIGRSADRKPRPGQLGPDGTTPILADYPDGSVLTEVDTGLSFVWHEKRWNQVKHPLYSLFMQLLAESKKQTELLEELRGKKGD